MYSLKVPDLQRKQEKVKTLVMRFLYFILETCQHKISPRLETGTGNSRQMADQPALRDPSSSAD